VGAYLAMARVALDRLQPEEFDDWIARVAAAESVAPEPHVRVEAALLLAARRQTAGDPERALSGLHATASEIDVATLPRRMWERWCLAEADLLVGLGDRPRARDVLDRLGPAISTTSVLGTARLLIQLGDASGAAAARARVQPERHPRGTVDAALLDTALALAAEDVETPLDRLEEALAAAAPWFLRRPFLTEAVDLRPILEQRLADGTVVPGFAVDVLARLSGAVAAAPDQSAVDPLTERERTVLRYLASTMSNAEIAAVLYVSVNTVKTHERSLYRKLDVTNRREAVSRARELNLL